MKERKTNPITIRLTDDEKNALDGLSERMDKSRSDVLLRACKFFMIAGDGNTGGYIGGSSKDSDQEGDGRKTHRVNLRMPESDMDSLRRVSTSSGDSVSQLIRKAIRALADGNGIHY